MDLEDRSLVILGKIGKCDASDKPENISKQDDLSITGLAGKFTRLRSFV